MKGNQGNVEILKRLGNIPTGTMVLHINTSLAFLMYLEVTKSHCFYIVIDKKV